jgi:hypothetical protein
VRRAWPFRELRFQRRKSGANEAQSRYLAQAAGCVVAVECRLAPGAPIRRGWGKLPSLEKVLVAGGGIGAGSRDRGEARDRGESSPGWRAPELGGPN